MKSYFLVFLLSLVFASSSHSETIPATTTYTIQSATATHSGSSATAACGAMISFYNGTDNSCKPFTYIGNPELTMACQPYTAACPSSTWQGYPIGAGALSCPSGYTLSGNTCTRADCSAGQTRLPDGTCSRDCNAIKSTSYTGYVPANSNPVSVCQDGCAATVKTATNQAAVDGVQVIAGQWSYTGGSCTGNNITGGSPPACPTGQCAGTINGQTTCFTCSEVGKEATNYTSTSDTTVKTTTYGADGTSTSNVTDTVSGTTGPSTPGPSSQPTEQQTYCEQNPQAAQCMQAEEAPIAEPIINSAFSLDINPVTVGGSGSCPAPGTYTLGGKSYPDPAYTRS